MWTCIRPWTTNHTLIRSSATSVYMPNIECNENCSCSFPQDSTGKTEILPLGSRGTKPLTPRHQGTRGRIEFLRTTGAHREQMGSKVIFVIKRFLHYQSSTWRIPRLIARVTAWARSDARSLRKMCWRCILTVPLALPSLPPISLLPRPSPTRFSTSTSR